MSAQPQMETKFGVVKQVNSVDTIVIKHQLVKNQKPEETIVGLTSIKPGKLAWPGKLNSEEPTKEPMNEEPPYAWEAREFLRKKLVGKEVFCIGEKGPTKFYATVYLGKDTSGENVAESLVSEGLAEVRRNAIRFTEAHQRLCELEDIAKAAGKGLHGPNKMQHVRNIVWTIDNPQNFKDSLHLKPVKAVVEKVRDGSTFRLVLLPGDFPEYYYINFMLSGIRCPVVRSDGINEEYAELVQYFTESRLLQRDVEVILEGVSNQNFLGTVIHPNGNIAELLLINGLAKCVDWSLQIVTSGVAKYRAAEKQAKQKQLWIWKNYTPSGPVIDDKDREFQGKVVEVFNADAMNIKLADGQIKKVFLASIRPPRLPDTHPDSSKPRNRPLYDIPHMYEAREFLRKKLIGKKVNVIVDYIQPKNNSFPEKTCCTITIGGVNVAEALVSKGLANVVKHRADDDQRSFHYDELLAAETKAQKSGKGMFNKKEAPILRIVDLSGDLQKSKLFFKKGVKMEAVVEFVASGSRLRLFVPRENFLVTFLLAGISCARASRDTKTGPQPGEPYGDEALAYTKDLCLQKEVQIEIESMDKVGNYIGYLWIDNQNVSEGLLLQGFAEIHPTATKSAYYKSLLSAQEKAQAEKRKIWEFHEPKEVEKGDEATERIVDYKTVLVTEIRVDLNFFCQYVDEGPKLEETMQNLRHEFKNNPPVSGSYSPKRGELCAACFSEDDQWYRAKIDKVQANGVQVTYIDYGNRETINATRLATLPSTYHSLPACAHECAFAFVKVTDDVTYQEEAQSEFYGEIDKTLLQNIEYKVGPISYVTLLTADEKKDIGKELITKGFVLAEKRKERRFQKIICDYSSAQTVAKTARAKLWCYGDITEDDAKEFG